MFVCEKVARGHRYLYLVESVREGKRVRQRTIRALGRKDVLHASGELDRLIASLARHSERAMVLSDMEAGRLACIRIGGPLLFGRLWERLGLGAVANDLLDGRGFEFALERAVFVSVLHRLFVSGSDRSCEKWMSDYAIPGVADLRLHHLYRAMAWLGEELEPAGDGDLAPRCVKDEIEERLFERRRDLFTDLSLVFMDTTTLSFHGAGGESLGAHGHSKDHRPDLRQMVLAVVLDGQGRPVCTEMLAGNTADMTVLLPVVDRLRKRFGIGRVCVVADWGMISAATIAALEERSLDYILGARERGTAVIREVVLKSEKPFTPLLIERGRGDTQLFVKQVTVNGARYIVCRNEAEAEKDRADRQAIVAGLQKRHASGDKALIGNSAYRRYLRRTGGGQGVRDRRRQAGRRGPLRRHLRAQDQRHNDAAQCSLEVSRVAPGRGSVPPGEDPAPHPADLSFLRRRHPRPRLLLFPGAGAPEGVGRPLPGCRRDGRVGRSDPRSGPLAGGDHREGRQARHHAHLRRGPGRTGLPGRRRRPAVELARTARLTRTLPEM